MGIVVFWNVNRIAWQNCPDISGVPFAFFIRENQYLGNGRSMMAGNIAAYLLGCAVSHDRGHLC